MRCVGLRHEREGTRWDEKDGELMKEGKLRVAYKAEGGYYEVLEGAGNCVRLNPVGHFLEDHHENANFRISC